MKGNANEEQDKRDSQKRRQVHKAKVLAGMILAMLP
jgi:hypothetical protein